jgi:broad specificity phosphatase PhoE
MPQSFLDTPHHIYLLRHGIATHSTTGYGDQILTAELLPEAYPVIHRLGVYLRSVPSQMNFGSTVLRCRQTVEVITKETGKLFRFDPRLSEYHQETFEEFAARTRECLTDLLAEADEVALKKQLPNSSASIIICTHGAVIASLKNLLLKDHFLLEDELNYTQPGQLLHIFHRTAEVLDFN